MICHEEIRKNSERFGHGYEFELNLEKKMGQQIGKDENTMVNDICKF